MSTTRCPHGKLMGPRKGWGGCNACAEDWKSRRSGRYAVASTPIEGDTVRYTVWDELPSALSALPEGARTKAAEMYKAWLEKWPMADELRPRVTSDGAPVSR